MAKFKENDAVLNTRTGETGVVHMVYDKGEFDFYYVELSGLPHGRFASWCETGLELIYEAK